MVSNVSEVAAIPEPEIGKEAPAEHDLFTSTEEAPAISTSGPETSYAKAIEWIPASIDHNLLAESGSLDDEKNSVNRSETVEPRATEAEQTLYTVEGKTDGSASKTGDTAPNFAATEQSPEVTFQEIVQPLSTTVLVTEDDQDNSEYQVENITSSRKSEGHGTTENIEAKKDFVDVKEVDLTCFS